MALPHNNYFTATHWVDNMLFQVSHFCSYRWHHIVLAVSLLLSWVAFSYTRYFTAQHNYSFASCYVSHFLLGYLSFIPGVYCCSLWWVPIVSGVSLLITRVTFSHFRCLISAHWAGSKSFQVLMSTKWCGFAWPSIYISYSGGSAFSEFSHCCLLRWLCVISGAPMPLTCMARCHSRCLIASNSGGCALFQVSHWCSLVWLCVIPGVLLSLSVGFALCKMSNCCSLGFLRFIQGISLSLICVTLCCFRCPTVSHKCGYASSQVLYCC